MTAVEPTDQLPIGCSRCLEFLVTHFQLTGEIDRLLLKGGNAALELVDVIRAPESGVSPRLLAEELGELALQGPDPRGETAGAFLGVGQVGLE
ncbi:hypothetical protein [Kitasatospora sp. DSM 101779]|uniref:hypothetical protein n=1 Tax=Kitasatospora sp. DSM 101779 TaxID=2853165 RepID=UPI0021DA3A19|nr:hypothetical protein [Kitasatospora sp. DSM 101779]MCU7827227.1 hypothetical protein [Kitasatospora sp. DSM 101779]